MITNYFKIAWRNLKTHKVFTAINVTGLATGVACCLLLAVYLKHQLSFDKFNTNADRIVRVIMDYSIGDASEKGNYTSTKVWPAFQRNFPEIESGARMEFRDAVIKYDGNIIKQDQVLYADSTLFNIFSFPLLEGNVNTALSLPNSIVVSQSTARKIFGNENPVGKNLLVNGKQNMVVTGVVADCPANSQIQYNMIVSFLSLGKAVQEETYWNANYTTYLLLKNKGSIESLQSKIGPFMEKEMKEARGSKLTYELEPLLSVHLHSPFDAMVPNLSMMYIYIIAGIALLILAIACFTYINLSTAHSMQRAKEVGIRKVSGAYRAQVFWQFIIESVLVTLFASIIGFSLAFIFLPGLNQLAQTQLKSIELFTPAIIVSLLMLIVLIAFFAGSYPATILSGFQPVKVLKGRFNQTVSGNWLRKSLIVFQFAISVFLIVATIIISQQLKYIQHKKLGFNKDHVLMMGLPGALVEKEQLIKSELLANSHIKAVSLAYDAPLQINGGYSMGKDAKVQNSVTANPIDENFLNVNDIQLITGDNINRQDVLDVSHDSDSLNYYRFLINESAARSLGYTPQEAIGKRLYLDPTRPGEIKGVVKDFNFRSLHNPIQPLVLFPGGWRNLLLIKVDGQNIAGTLAFMKNKLKELDPERPFEYKFMDEAFDKMYTNEVRTGKIFTIFASIAILLACLGLFGLSAYEARQRIKEIGVRKVLGASVTDITTLLSGSFLKLVVIAVVVAAPLSWLAMNKWLQSYSYRIDFEWWVLVLAGLIAGIIAMITVSFQAIKAALTNPVESLRTE